MKYLVRPAFLAGLEQDHARACDVIRQDSDATFGDLDWTVRAFMEMPMLVSPTQDATAALTRPGARSAAASVYQGARRGSAWINRPF